MAFILFFFFCKEHVREEVDYQHADDFWQPRTTGARAHFFTVQELSKHATNDY